MTWFGQTHEHLEHLDHLESKAIKYHDNLIIYEHLYKYIIIIYIRGKAIKALIKAVYWKILQDLRLSSVRRYEHLRLYMSIFNTTRKRRDASLMLKVGFSSLQRNVVDIIFLIRHKVIANKQVTEVGYYFRGRGKKRKFCPIMRHIQSYFPISRSFLGNFGQFCPHIFEVNHEHS